MKPKTWMAAVSLFVTAGLFGSTGWASQPNGLTPELRQKLQNFYQKKTGVLYCKALQEIYEREPTSFSVHPLPDGFAVSITDPGHGFLSVRVPEREVRFDEGTDGVLFRLESHGSARRRDVSLEVRAMPDNDDWYHTSAEYPIPGALIYADNGQSLITAFHSICRLD